MVIGRRLSNELLFFQYSQDVLRFIRIELRKTQYCYDEESNLIRSLALMRDSEHSVDVSGRFG